MSRRLERPATLTRELAVRVIDLSASGCLVESGRRMEVGTIGTLLVRLGDEECEDDVEVVRCDAVKGVPNLYHVGVRLLWTTPRRAGTIRQAAANRLAIGERAETPRVM
jgi:hypothetical protein